MRQQTWPGIVAQPLICILGSEPVSQSLGFLTFYSFNDYLQSLLHTCSVLGTEETAASNKDTISAPLELREV